MAKFLKQLRRWAEKAQVPARQSAGVGNENLRQVIAGLKKSFVGVIAFSAAINLLMLAVPLYMLQLFDRVLATQNVDTLIVLTLMVGISILALALLDVIRTRIMARLASWSERRLAADALAGAIVLARTRLGLPSAQSLRDLTQLRSYLGGSSIFPLLDAPWVPVFLVVVFFMHPLLGVIATGGAVALITLALANEFLIREPVKAANEITIRSLNEADALVRNSDGIVAMGMLPALVRHWSRDQQLEDTQKLRTGDRAGSLLGVAKFLRLGLQIAILGTGALLATRGEITGGAMIAASIIMGRALAPIEQLIPAWRALIGVRQTYKRFAMVLALVPDAAKLASGLERPSGAMKVERLTYRSDTTKAPILRNINFALEPGEVLGIIGPSGAGKTTLARLIVGSLTPTDGAVLLDEVNLTNWLGAERGQYVGYLPQDVELFDGTVRDNISRFQAADDEAVMAATHLSGTYDLISGLPQAFNTQIGAAGVPLSGGQRQRVALARSVYNNPALVVLDEPNSNLDGPGEQALVETVQRLKKMGITVVLIAQRPNIINHTDKLLVLRDGAVSAFGPRAEVIEKLGLVRPVGEPDAHQALPMVQPSTNL